MKQRAIRERRNHKPQDARRFNCRLNCGPTRTYATTLEATRPSLSRALPISSLALAALSTTIARYTHVAILCPVCASHISCALTFRCPKQKHIPASATSSHMAVQKSTLDCRTCRQPIPLVPHFCFFASDRLSLTHARLQKRKACALMWLETHPRRGFRR